MHGLVEYHLWRGDIDGAADGYRRSIAERDPVAIVFAYAPHGRALRGSARRPALAKAMNLL